MLYFSQGDETTSINDQEVKEAVVNAIDSLGLFGKILIIPPDITRIHSGAGKITEMIWKHYGKKISDILPALGTHKPMTSREKKIMFGSVPVNIFREHNWRNDIINLGDVPGAFLSHVSEGKVDYNWPVQVNNLINSGRHELIISIGQVVPHEVIGMANHNKNIFVGCGGPEGINKSHFLGAVYGMERIMGKIITPVREVLNFGESAYASHLNILYILTVLGTNNRGELKTKGLYIGTGNDCFLQACELSARINFTQFDKPLKKAIIYLDPSEYRSTWLGNKSIYRTRMAMADGGELIVLAPGVKEFGEDKIIDKLIRKYGYHTSEEVLELVRLNEDLQDNLSVAAHLIHGSTENRFRVTYCPGKLSRDEVVKAGFAYGSYEDLINKYDPAKLKDGFNFLPDGEEIYYISNPALGLWAEKSRIKN